MDWATIAIISTALMGVASVVDSHLLSRRLPSMRAFMFPVSFIHLFFATLAIIFYPMPQGIGLLPVLVMVGSGCLRTAAIFLMLYPLRKVEVSRVIPIIYTSPIFVTLLAAPILGEAVGLLSWVAVIIVVMGAVLITVERHPTEGSGGIGGVFFMLFASSVCWAISDIMRKYGLDFMSYWNGFSISTFIMGGTFLAVSLNRTIIGQWRDLPDRKKALGYVALDESVSIIGIVLQFWAMQNGPVSLVATIIASRPVFVAIYSIILSFLLPEFLIRIPGKRTMIMRFVAIGLIFAGISIIYTM